MKSKVQIWRIWGSGNRCHEFLETASPKKHTIFFCHQEREIEIDFDYKIFEKVRSGDIIFGTFSKKFHRQTTNINEAPHVKLHIWPNYFLYQTFSHTRPEKSTENLEPKALFTCMNHQPHEHRVMMLDMLAKKGLLKNNFYSWHFPKLNPGYQPRYWDKQINHIDGKFVGQQDHFPQAMYESVIDVITESTDVAPFITEKTYNAIVFKKPFMILGYPGTHAELERQGYNLPRDVIDYSFDNEPDTLKRAEMIADELVRLSKFDLKELQAKLQPSVEHNRRHAIKVARRQEGIPQVILDHKYCQENFLEDIQCKLDLLE